MEYAALLGKQGNCPAFVHFVIQFLMGNSSLFTLFLYGAKYEILNIHVQ